jgi:hypothetical protein
MSKPLPPHGITHRAPAEQTKYFADLFRASINRESFARVKSNADKFGLRFSDDELLVIAALDTPDKVQEFLNTQIYYNNDHASIDTEETVMPPRRVLQTGLAHCFEGAMFAYTVNFLHGHNPRWVLLEATQDSDHNLVIHRDSRTGLYGCNAHSAFPNLDGRNAKYATIRAMADSYRQYYYSDRTNNPNDLTLIGYSDEFDLAKFGTAWIASEENLWDIYYTYVDDSVRFHFFDAPNESHLYPLVHALTEKWIELDTQSQPFVNVAHLPQRAQGLWHAFWQLHGTPEPYHRPIGEALTIEQEFFRITNTTPIDLADNAFDFQFFLASGYHVEDLIRNK